MAKTQFLSSLWQRLNSFEILNVYTLRLQRYKEGNRKFDFVAKTLSVVQEIKAIDLLFSYTQYENGTLESAKNESVFIPFPTDMRQHPLYSKVKSVIHQSAIPNLSFPIFNFLFEIPNL